MNPVLILTHNCLELTKACVESLDNQNIITDVFVYDNGSTDGTHDWLVSKGRPNKSGRWTWHSINCVNSGVSHGWNTGLGFLFDEGADHVLVVNNDTFFPPWFYRDLLATQAQSLARVEFVTGVSVGTMEEIATPPPPKSLVESPDFSAFLIFRSAWEKIGEFDESMVHYASDLDYHIRAHRKGVHLWNAGVPFYHERSSTLKNASAKDRRKIELQADADRARLTEKWGCRAWDDSYHAMFDASTFGVDNCEVTEADE